MAAEYCPPPLFWGDVDRSKETFFRAKCWLVDAKELLATLAADIGMCPCGTVCATAWGVVAPDVDSALDG